MNKNSKTSTNAVVDDSSKCYTRNNINLSQEQRSRLRSTMREVYTIVDTGAKRDRQSNVDIAKLLMERTNAMMRVMPARANPRYAT